MLAAMTTSRRTLTQRVLLILYRKKNVNTQIALTVGSRQFSVFELQKNYKIFKQRFLQNNQREPGEADVKTWINEFVERAYVLEDANEKGYYNRNDVKNIVEGMAMIMLSQPTGILEQKLTANVAPQNLAEKNSAEKEKAAIVNEYYAKINKAAVFNPDKSVILWLQNVLNTYKKKNAIRKEDIAAGSDKKLASYHTPDGSTKTISIEDFVNYYNNLPFRRHLNDTAVIISYLHQIPTDIYIRKDAEEMGLLEDPEFRLNKINFTNNVVYQKYMEEQLGADRGVTENDIMNVYTSVKQRMTHPTNIVYSLYTFSNRPNAHKAFSLLRMRSVDTTVNLNSLSQKRHIKFNKNQNQLPDTLKKMIYHGASGQPLPPIETNGYFTILMLESATGSELFTANEIRPYLMARAKERRELNYCSKKANELSKTLKAENNIDINMLTSSGLPASL
jgi:hypothetical protein